MIGLFALGGLLVLALGVLLLVFVDWAFKTGLSAAGSALEVIGARDAAW